MNNLNLEAVFLHLLQKEPFYGLYLQPIVTHVMKGPFLAGVNVKNGKINLYINPLSWNALASIEEKAEVLKHEIDHVVLEHLSRFSKKAIGSTPSTSQTDEDKAIDRMVEDVKGQMLHKQANWACDLAINEHLPKLPKTIKLFDTKGQQLPEEGRLLFVAEMQKQYPDMLPKEHANYYYEFLQKNKSKGGGEAGQGEGNGHEMWDMGDDIDPETLREICKQHLNRVMDQQPGHVPGHVQQAWIAMNKATHNWAQTLRKFCASARAAETEDTRKRRNRRYGTLLPGYRTKEQLQLVVGFDSSGSIGEELISKFMAEIAAIHKTGAEITLVVCDAEIHSVEKYTPRAIPKIVGGGGTLYQPIFDKAKELGCDALVVLGDGYCADTPVKPGFPVLWAISEGGKAPVDWGMRIQVK